MSEVIMPAEGYVKVRCSYTNEGSLQRHDVVELSPVSMQQFCPHYIERTSTLGANGQPGGIVHFILPIACLATLTTADVDIFALGKHGDGRVFDLLSTKNVVAWIWKKEDLEKAGKVL